MRLIQALLAMLVALLLGVAPAAAQTYPKFTGLVVDAANVLPPATKADLTAKLEALQKDTKRQLVVATIPDLQGREIEEYGVGLGRAWGVGLKDANNGAILFIAPNAPKGHRGPRLEVGYSLEPILTDAFAGTMIREKMMPKLTQSGDIAGAMEAGTDAVIAQLRASPEEAKANVDAAAAKFDKVHKRSAAGSGGGIPFGVIMILFVIGFIVSAFVAGWFAERAWDRRPLLAFAGFALASAVPFVFGIPYLAYVLNVGMGLELTFWQILEAGLFPFIVGGIVKAALAALIVPGAWALVRRIDATKRS